VVHRYPRGGGAGHVVSSGVVGFRGVCWGTLGGLFLRLGGVGQSLAWGSKDGVGRGGGGGGGGVGGWGGWGG